MSNEKPSAPQAPSLEQSAPAQNRPTVVVDQQKKNAIGMAGFLCSVVALVALISFLPVVFSRFVFLLPFSYSFLVLFPLSLLLSLIGVFYRPRGWAIAGLVISVGVGGPLLALFGLMQDVSDQLAATNRKEIAQNTAAYDEIKKSPAFQAACEKIENSPAVQAKIGAPVKLSGWYNDGDGSPQTWNFSARGPKGIGDGYIVLHRDSETHKWSAKTKIYVWFGVGHDSKTVDLSEQD